MTVEAIAAVAAASEAAQFLPATGVAAPAAPAAGFGAWFAQEVGAVNNTLVQTDIDMKKLVAGESQSLHEVMIHMEEAKLSFQLLAQVRNRMLEAYQEVMRMQV